jgi:peptidoglycan/xylan/chitin deacetylase (PgdA/CDA1 family)
MWLVPAQQGHVFLTILNSLFYELWRSLGYKGGGLLPLGLLACFFGAVGAASFFILLKQIFRNNFTALLCSIGLACSKEYWRYSVQPETHIIPAAFFIISMIFIIKLSHEGLPKYVFLSGAFFSISIFFSQANIIFLPAFIGFIFASGNVRDRFRRAMLYCMTVSLLWLTPFTILGLATFYSTHYNNSLSNFFYNWFRGSIDKTVFNIYPDPLLVLKTMAASVITLKYDLLSIASVYGLIALTFLTAWKKIIGQYRNIFVFTLGVFLISLAVFSFYEPYNSQRYVPLLSALWIFFGFFIDEMSDKKKIFFARIIPALCVIPIFFHNLFFPILWQRDPGNNSYLQGALSIRQNTLPGDMVITDNMERGQYIRYFSKRDTVYLDETVYQNGRFEKYRAYMLRKKIDSELKSGKGVYISGDILTLGAYRYKATADFLNSNYFMEDKKFSNRAAFFCKMGKAKNRAFYNGNRDIKKVALTFDDGPNEPFTGHILDILRREGIKATFFVTGKNVEKYPESLIRISEEGHDIGNHSYSHPDFYKTAKQDIEEEIMKTDKIIKNTINKDSFLFRPPYIYLEEVDCPGYVTIMDSMSPSDWSMPGVARIEQRVLSRARNGDIILLHDGDADNVSGGNRKQTVKALFFIIKDLKREGYQLVTVSELLGL